MCVTQGSLPASLKGMDPVRLSDCWTAHNPSAVNTPVQSMLKGGCEKIIVLKAGRVLLTTDQYILYYKKLDSIYSQYMYCTLASNLDVVLYGYIYKFYYFCQEINPYSFIIYVFVPICFSKMPLVHYNFKLI